MDILIDERTEDFAYWLSFDSRPHVAEWPYVSECLLRVQGGVLHAVQRYVKRPSRQQLRADTREHGVESPRPYQLGQYCDGSITPAVIALYVDFCQRRGLDPAALYAAAYPDREERETFTSTVELAEWEGVAYPNSWTDEAVQGLLRSLEAANMASLIDEVTAETGVRLTAPV